MKILIDISQNQLNALRILIGEEIIRCENGKINHDHLYNITGVYKVDLEDLIKQLS